MEKKLWTTKEKESIALLVHKAVFTHRSSRNIIGTAAFLNFYQAPAEELKTEGKQTGPLEYLDCRLEDADNRELKTVITTNVLVAATNTSQPTVALSDDSVDMKTKTLWPQKLGIPCYKFHSPSTSPSTRNHMTWTLRSTNLRIAYVY